MAECPYCHTSPAYVSMSSVECSNVKCAHYSKTAYPPPADENSDETKPQYLWCMYHTDCGD